MKVSVLDQPRTAALLTVLAVFLCVSSCNKNKDAQPAALPKADLLGSEDLSPEGFSNETTASSGRLALPTDFGRRTGDLDGIGDPLGRLRFARLGLLHVVQWSGPPFRVPSL